MQSGASAKENMYDNYAELQGALKLMSSRSNHRYLATSEIFGKLCLFKTISPYQHPFLCQLDTE